MEASNQGQSAQTSEIATDAVLVDDKFDKSQTTDRLILMGDYPGNISNRKITNILTKEMRELNVEMTNTYIQTGYIGNQFIVYIDKNTQYHLIDGQQHTNQYPILQYSDIVHLNKLNVKISTIYMNSLRDKVFWITDDNQVFGRGANRNGELGIDGGWEITVPQIIKQLCDKHIVDIQFGESYSIVLAKEDKETAEFVVEYWCRKERFNVMPKDVIKLMIVYYECHDVYSTNYCAFGGNGHSINDQNNIMRSFKRIKAFENINIVKISVGRMHSMFLDSNGVLWTSGYDWPGYCGIGDRFSIYKPMQLTYFVENKIKINNVKCGGMHTLAIDENGRIYGWGNTSNHQCKKPKLIEYFNKDIICDIECGYQHSYCKTSDNKHYLWGNNTFNQCMGGNAQRIVKVANYINKIIEERGMKIKSISLGYNDTKLIVMED